MAQPPVVSVGQSGKPQFPVDFFEHCSQLQDIEFEGNDLLEVYNREQLKTRLSSNSLYVVCTKRGGFKLEIVNGDSSMVMTGKSTIDRCRLSPIIQWGVCILMVD